MHTENEFLPVNASRTRSSVLTQLFHYLSFHTPAREPVAAQLTHQEGQT